MSLPDDAEDTADRTARRAAQTGFAAPLVVEAGAGTGKTTTLVARVLAWSLGPGWERSRAALAGTAEPPARDVAARLLSRVVAITFTEAAAAEMADRLAAEVGRLAERAGAAPPWLETDNLPDSPERARRARALLGALDRLAVRTIHAFCRSLLAAHPLEAGLHPELTVDADGRALAQVAREVVEARLARGYGEPGDPHLLALAGAGHGPQEIVEALIELARAGVPAAALAEDPLGPARVGALHRRLGRAVAALHELIGHRLDGARRTTNAAALARGLAALAARLWGPTAAPPDLAALRAWVDEALPPKLADHLKHWRAGRLNQTEARALGGDEAELAEHAAALQDLVEHLRRLDPELLAHGFGALAPLAAELERELVARGIATFEALLVGAASLLARHPGVRSRVRRGIDQLLVDEFQDTDRLQCELLGWLALDGPADERPGLFLVGDPKQSIYGWRSADLAAYDGFVARVVADGGKVVALTESFRSAPPILAEVARVIAPVMREERGRQPAFARLVPSRQGEPGFVRDDLRPPRPARPVEHWISWVGDEGSRPGLGRTRAADAAELEATAIARDLAHFHACHGVPYGNAAILLRSTGRLDTYLDALRRAGIPFLVGRDTQYYRRREVIEAAALVRAVLDPGDHLALLTVLRSPLVGVPDTALVPLWRRGFPRLVTDLAAPRRERLERIRAAVDEAAAEVFGGAAIPGLEHLRGWAGSLLAAVEHLGLLRASFESEPAGIFLERLRRLFLPEAIEAARYLGPYRLANLERFFRQLGAALEEGEDANAVLRLLRVSVAEAREAEEGRPREGMEDAVSVLTIHGAKGLEFDHVYLAQLHAGSRPLERPAVEAGRLASTGHPEDADFEVRLFGAPSLGFDLLEAERAAVEAAERVRTLYVAMTRARERLVLLGTWPESAVPRPPEQARTHMELLLSRPDRPREPLVELWREAVERGVWAIEDPAGVLWKLPALEPAPEEPPVAGFAVTRLPEPGEVKHATDVLGQRRAAARVRMARPWSAAASEEAHERLREAMAEQALDEKTGAPLRPAPSRDAALAAGGAVHRALETWDLAADPAAELARQRRLLPGYLAVLTSGEVEPAALARAEALLDRFASGPLLGRFAALREHLLARELPVLLPPDLQDDEGDGAVGVVSGAVDLLYRDQTSGDVVVADYKTDEVADAADLAARAAAYGAQGAVYARAVREALGLPRPPRFELWFLAAGRVVEVPVQVPVG